MQKQNNKHYSSNEQEQKAENNYVKAAADIEAHNSRKNETFKRKATNDADMSYSEKRVKRMGLKPPQKRVQSRMSPKLSRRVKGDDEIAPNATDYRFVFAKKVNFCKIRKIFQCKPDCYQESSCLWRLLGVLINSSS